MDYETFYSAAEKLLLEELGANRVTRSRDPLRHGEVWTVRLDESGGPRSTREFELTGRAILEQYAECRMEWVIKRAKDFIREIKLADKVLQPVRVPRPSPEANWFKFAAGRATENRPIGLRLHSKDTVRETVGTVSYEGPNGDVCTISLPDGQFHPGASDEWTDEVGFTVVAR